jgi:hypothetical protein
MSERVKFQGRLQGCGKQATCGGWVTKVVHPDAIDVGYGDYMIDDATVSPPLPDAVYELLAHERIYSVTRLNGRWISES